MIIYKIVNKLNGKMYIGQTVQKLLDRWSDHCRPANGKHTNKSAIGSAIKKYGKENFTLEVIDIAKDLSSLNLMEQTYIKALNTLFPNGYNLQLGGDRKECHEITKKKISEKLKGRPFKNRMNGAPKGRPVSEERRKQISNTMTGKPQPWKYKKVLAVETGVIYESVNAAAKVLKVNRVTISGLIKSGKQGKLGLTFRFVNKT